jgi:hypothetical protein
MEIIDGFGDMIYSRNDSFNVHLMGNNLQNYSQTNESAIGISA